MKKLIPFLFLMLSACATITQDPFDLPPEELLKKAEEAYAGKLYESSREYLDALKARDVERKYTAKVQLMKADSYFIAENFPEAAVEYRAFLSLHTYHDDAPYAQLRLALSYFNQIDTVDRGYENITRAREEFQNLLKRYPRNPYREIALGKIDQCTNMLAEYENYVATFYYNKGAYRAAIGRFESLLAAYPSFIGETDILLRLGKSYLKVDEKDKAASVFRTLIEKYPSSKQADEARGLLENP